MEPVGVVTGTVVHGPALHAFGHTVGKGTRDGLLVLNGGNEGIVGGLRKILVHFFAVEHRFCVVGFGAFCGDLHGNCLSVEGFFDHFKSQR